jgi:nicotinamidase/pyrazinamidase
LALSVLKMRPFLSDLAEERRNSPKVNDIVIDPSSDALIVVDVQPTFMELDSEVPGTGELAVPGAASVIPVINGLQNLFSIVVATQDWHPRGHSSFASRHPSKAPFDVIQAPYGEQRLWPDHGVAGTPGANLHPNLQQEKITMVVRKGFRPEVDSYSAFKENDGKTTTGLEAWLRGIGITRVFVCGVTRPVCVDFTAEDACNAGFSTIVIEDACSRLGNDAELLLSQERLEKSGVVFRTSEEVIAAARPQGDRMMSP